MDYLGIIQVCICTNPKCPRVGPSPHENPHHLNVYALDQIPQPTAIICRVLTVGADPGAALLESAVGHWQLTV